MILVLSYFYDKYHKNIIYIHNKYHNIAEKIDVPQRTTTEKYAENHHWINWVLLRPSKLLKTNGKAILISSYYRSPNRTKSKYDISNILLDLKHILSQYPAQYVGYIFIAGDFNIKHPNISLSTVSEFPATDINEYEYLSQILVKYNLEIINIPEIPTYYAVQEDQIISSVLDLSIASVGLVDNYYEWETLDISGSDHKAILSTFYLSKQQQNNLTHFRNNNNNSNKIKSKIATTIIPKYKFYAPKDINKYKDTVTQGTKRIYYKYKEQKSKHEQEQKYEVNKIETASYEFYSLIIQAANKYIGLSRQINAKKPWMTYKILEICKETQKMYKKWKRVKYKGFTLFIKS